MRRRIVLVSTPSKYEALLQIALIESIRAICNRAKSRGNPCGRNFITWLAFGH